MNKKHQALILARNKLMSDRKVVCTGNPNVQGTLANGFKKLFPDATFIHRSAGWDLADDSDVMNERLTKLFSQHNTFINASFIAPHVQTRLLIICNNAVKFCDVYNIGSTHEYDGLGSAEYVESKLQLRETSLKLNSFRFTTHHIILGGIANKDKDGTANWLDVDVICSVVPWIASQPFNVPIIGIDQFKDPW